jgi:hypothetical protein
MLAGRAMVMYRAAKVPIPAWVHINWIAHGLPSEIVGLARAEAGLRRPSGTWPWVTSTFADELLAGSTGDLSIVGQLQRDCLIPMELALMHPHSESVLPSHVVTLGIPHLLAHPSIRSS